MKEYKIVGDQARWIVLGLVQPVEDHEWVDALLIGNEPGTHSFDHIVRLDDMSEVQDPWDFRLTEWQGSMIHVMGADFVPAKVVEAILSVNSQQVVSEEKVAEARERFCAGNLGGGKPKDSGGEHGGSEPDPS